MDVDLHALVEESQRFARLLKNNDLGMLSGDINRELFNIPKWNRFVDKQIESIKEGNLSILSTNNIDNWFKLRYNLIVICKVLFMYRDPHYRNSGNYNPICNFTFADGFSFKSDDPCNPFFRIHDFVEEKLESFLHELSYNHFLLRQ